MEEKINAEAVELTRELIKPFIKLLEELVELHEVIDVSIKGLIGTEIMPKVIEFITGEAEGSRAKLLEEAYKAEEIAKKEIEKGYPLLYSHVALMSYAHLEGGIKAFMIGYFKNVPLVLKIKEIANLKITFSEYHLLDENERMDYLFSQYEKNVAQGIQYGITRFETLLRPIDLSGPVHQETANSIFELSQIRNVILHRGSIADKHFLQHCPTLGYSFGDKVCVTKIQYDKYYQALTNYIATIIIRLGKKFGTDVESFQAILKKNLEQIV